MSFNISCSCSRQNLRDCIPSFIIAVKRESPDEQHGFTLSIIKPDSCQFVWVVKVVQKDQKGKDSEFEFFVYWVFLHDSNDSETSCEPGFPLTTSKSSAD